MVYMVSTRRYASQRELYRTPSSLELGTMSRVSASGDTFNRILGRAPSTNTMLKRHITKGQNAGLLLPRTHQSRSNWALNEIRDEQNDPNRTHRHKSPTYERYSQCKSTLNLSWIGNEHERSNASMESSSSCSSSKCSSGSAIQSHRSLFDLSNINFTHRPESIQRHGSDRDIKRTNDDMKPCPGTEKKKLKAKQRASILWILAKASPDGRVPEQMQDPFYRDQQERDCLKPWITQRLASGELYAFALANIYGDPSLGNNGHKETLRLLAHKGVQVHELNTENEPISETLLMQTNPVRVTAHFVIVECILQLFVREILIPIKVGEVVARFTGTVESFDREGNFLPDQSELPSSSDPESVALYWINRACDQFNCEIARECSSSASADSEPTPFLPSLEELSDMCDGCSIFGLIAFYCVNIVSWRSIVLKENISIADSIHNLQKVQQFCLQYLPTHICFLTLEDFLYLPEPLISNFLAFIADLLYVFEIQPVDCVQAPCLRIDYDSDYERAYSEMPTPSEMKARSLRHHSWQVDDDSSLLHSHHLRRDGSPIYSSPSQMYETIAETRRQAGTNRRDSLHNHGQNYSHQSHGAFDHNGSNDPNGRIDTYFSTLTVSSKNDRTNRTTDNSQLNDYYTNLSSQFDIDPLDNQQIITPPSSGHHQRLKESLSQNTSASETSSLAELSEYSANDSVRAQLSENRRMIEKRTKQEKEKCQSVGQDFRQEVLKRLNNNDKKISSNPDLESRKLPKKSAINSTDDANLTFEIHELNPMRREGTYSMLAPKEQAKEETKFDKTKSRPKPKEGLERVDKSAEQFASSATFVKKDKLKDSRPQSTDSEEVSETKNTPPKQRQQWGAPVMPPPGIVAPIPGPQYPYPPYPGNDWSIYPNMYAPHPHQAPPYGYPSHYAIQPHPMHRYPYPVPGIDPRFPPGNALYQSPEYLQSLGYVLPGQAQAPAQQQQQPQQANNVPSVSSKSTDKDGEIILANHHFLPVESNPSPEPIPIESSSHEIQENIDNNAHKASRGDDKRRASSPSLKGNHAETFFISFDSEKEKPKKSPNTRTTTRPKSTGSGEKNHLSRTSTHVISHGNSHVPENKHRTHKEDPKIVAELYNVKPPQAPKAQAIAFLIEAEDVAPSIANGNHSSPGSNGIIHDPTEIEIQRKKEAMMKQSMKRRAEAEKKRIEKETEIAAKKADEQRKKEEQERKKEEAAAKRAAILEEYKKRKKEEEDAERDARSGMPRSSSTLVLNRASGGVSMRANRQSSAGRPRPKSLHGNALDGAGNANTVGERLSVSRDEIDLMRFTTASRPQSAANTPTFDNPYTSSNFCISTEYNGPRLFVKPSQKSNKTLMLNAINSVLAGAVNSDTNRRVSNVISSCDSKYYLILFRNAQLQYRAIYAYYPEREEDSVIKLDGNGPKRVTNEMIEKFYKYNSGTKNFNPIQTKHLSVTIDAFIIYNHLWQKTASATRPLQAATLSSRKFI